MSRNVLNSLIGLINSCDGRDKFVLQCSGDGDVQLREGISWEFNFEAVLN